jgi:WD40 repeat protein
MGSDRIGLDELLAGRPSAQAWEDARRLLERSDPDAVEAAASRIRSWPARLRPMPDAWWDDRRAGRNQPWHSLAAWRRLGDLDDVENGRPAGVRQVDDGGGSLAYFYNGATSVACLSDLDWLVVCAAMEAHHNGGDIVVWGAGDGVTSTMLFDGADFHDEALDVQVSPDGSIAVTSVEGRLYAWQVPGGQALWQVDLDPADGEDGDFEMEDMIARIGFSGDGRRVAAGSVAGGVRVLDSATGEVVFAVGEDSFDPVALDAGGARLAHGAPLGEVVVRAVSTGEVVLRHDTGLAKVNAVAFAADGAGLLVAGGSVGGVAPSMTETAEAVPAAVLLTIDGDQVVAERQVRPTGHPPRMSAESPFATMGTRAVWAEQGPMVFAADDNGAVLFDGAGRVLWTEQEPVVGNFSADGRVLVVVGKTVDAVFIDSLRSDEPEAGPDESASSRAGRTPAELLSGPPSAAAWAEVYRLVEGMSAEQVSAVMPLARAWPAQVRNMPDSWWQQRRAGVDQPWHALAGTCVLRTDLALPDNGGRRVPCSYRPVRVAAATPTLDLVAFGATVDRHAEGHQLVLCRFDDQGGQQTTVINDSQHDGWDTDLLFSPDNTMLVSAAGSEHGTVTAYSVASGQRLWRFQFDASPHRRSDWVRIGFSGDGRRLAAASHARGRVVVLDARTGAVVAEMPERARYASHVDKLRADAVALDSAGRRIAYGAQDEQSRVVVRDVESGEKVLQVEPEGLRQVMGVAFAPDDTAVAVSGSVTGEFFPERPCVWTVNLDGHSADQTGRVTCRTRAPFSGKAGHPSDLRMYDQPNGTIRWTTAGGWALFRGQNDASVLLDIHDGASVHTVPFGVSDAGAALVVEAATLVTVTKHGVLAWLVPA